MFYFSNPSTKEEDKQFAFPAYLFQNGMIKKQKYPEISKIKRYPGYFNLYNLFRPFPKPMFRLHHIALHGPYLQVSKLQLQAGLLPSQDLQSLLKANRNPTVIQLLITAVTIRKSIKWLTIPERTHLRLQHPLIPACPNWS